MLLDTFFEGTPAHVRAYIEQLHATIADLHTRFAETGMIVMGPNRLGGQRLYYLVMMHKDDPPCIVIFAEDEIEPDY